MKSIYAFSRGVLRTSLLSSLFILSAAEPATAVDQVADPCMHTQRVELGSTLRSLAQAGNDPDYYEVEVPSPGLVTVDVVVPVGAMVEAKLAFLGQLCQGGARDDATLVNRQIRGLVVLVENPGIYTFAVAAQDPLLALPAYKVRTGFASQPDMEEPAVIRIRPSGVAESEPEPDPDEVAESEPEPDPDEVTISTRTQDRMSLIVPAGLLSEACRQGEVDDHGESFGCATSLDLGTSATGALENDWGDDDDLFSFVLTAQHTVRLEAPGDSETIGELYDRYGHRLVVDDSGAGSGFHIVKTLAPGRYFVRVSGVGSSPGTYTLTSAILSW